MKNKKIFRIIIALVSVIVLLGALAVYLVFSSLNPISSDSETVVFEVPDSAASKDVFIKLDDEGIIKNGNIAYYYCRLFHKSSFYAGSYEIDKNWPVLEIVDYLSDQSNAIQNTVSICMVNAHTDDTCDKDDRRQDIEVFLVRHKFECFQTGSLAIIFFLSSCVCTQRYKFI